MFSRRHVLKQLVALGAIAGFGSLPGARAAAAGEPGAAARYHMPEVLPQALVWVAFGAPARSGVATARRCRPPWGAAGAGHGALHPGQRALPRG